MAALLDLDGQERILECESIQVDGPLSLEDTIGILRALAAIRQVDCAGRICIQSVDDSRVQVRTAPGRRWAPGGLGRLPSGCQVLLVRSGGRWEVLQKGYWIS